jgi:hypothetical protein
MPNGDTNDYTHKVLATRFPDLTDDKLLKMYNAGLKPSICNELRLSRPHNLVEVGNIPKMIKRKLPSQQRVAFEPPEKTTSYSPQSHYSDTKYHHSEKDKKKENNFQRCGKKWILGHQCEENSLHYLKIVDGKEVEILDLGNEITIRVQFRIR